MGIFMKLLIFLYSAKGIQTLFNLNSANQVYERNKKKNVSDWDQEKADRVLDSWQRAFVKVSVVCFCNCLQSPVRRR